MKNFATLATELNQANKYFAKFVKKGDDKAALMWAEKIEQLEKEIDALPA